MSRLEDIAAIKSGKFLSIKQVADLRSSGMDEIIDEFTSRLFRATGFPDTLNIYWSGGSDFTHAGYVEGTMRMLVCGQRTPVYGEFSDLWLLCYPDDGETKQSVEREIDRMIEAVRNLAAGNV